MGENSDTKLTPISQARSYEEIGEFWNTHDTADFAEQFEEVTVEVRAPRHRRVPIESDIYESIRAEATRRGVSAETLINLLLSEHLVRSDAADKLLAEKKAAYKAE